MRDGEPRLVDLLVPVEEQIEVERARAVLAGDADAAEALLGREKPVEELARDSVVSSSAAPLRKSGCGPTPTGSVSRSVETATTSMPSSSASASRAARIVASRSPRFAPRPMYARVTAVVNAWLPPCRRGPAGLHGRFPDGHADAVRSETPLQLVGHRACERLEQAELPRVGDFPDGGATVDVIDSVFEPICHAAVADVEVDVEEEVLPRLALGVVDAVVPEHAQVVDVDRDHAIAPATVSASTGRLDVVDAEDRRAALERGDGGRDARAEEIVASRSASSASSCARSRRAPAGRARARCPAAARARGCARPSCRSRCRDRGRSAPPGIPPRPRTRAAPRGTPRPRRQHRRTAARPASSAARPACA